MCGVFGFVANGDRGPSLKMLRLLAKETQSRGRHAFGLAYVNHDDETVRTWKAPGDADQHLAQLDEVANARIVIGHCRWATHGSPDDNGNNHPHEIRKSGGWLVHNGVVRNYREIVKACGARMRTECDSESLAILLGKLNGSVSRRLAKMAELSSGVLAVLSIMPGDDGRLRLGAVRRGNPLHYAVSRHGYYFASLPNGLGYAREFPDLTSWEFNGAKRQAAAVVATLQA
jgi:glucosamine 6-phosphate synthetase-like amidotransferase/phosphosugar isomerase protein